VTFWAIRFLVITPIRRLRDDLEAELAGAREGVRRSRTEEVDRIVRAILEQARQDIAPKRTVRALVVVPSLGLLVLGCLAGSAVTLDGSLSARMKLQVEEGRRSTEAVAAAVRHDLENGLAGLAAAGRSIDSGSVQLDAALPEVLRTRPIFKAVYVVDPGGRVVEERGDGRAAFGSTPASGLSTLNDSGPEPVVVAAVPLVDGAALVAEYDIAGLNGQLKEAGAPIIVVDPHMRTILSNEGYLAFAPMDEQHIRDAITRAATIAPAAVEVPDSDSRTAFVRGIGLGDQSAALGWTVVQRRDLAAAAFAADPTSRTAVVVYGAAAGLLVILLGWTYVVTLRPLSRIAKHACLMASAESSSDAESALIAPQHINEVGAVAAALNRRTKALHVRKTQRAVAGVDSLTVPIRLVRRSDFAPQTVVIPLQARGRRPLAYEDPRR
jgi:hypothetical protein